MKKIVTTTAFPFIPAELNAAHFASTYLPADIYNRFMKIFGYNSVLVSATDVHGTWVKRELKNKSVEQHELLHQFHERYKKLFKSLQIEFDEYGRTDSPKLLDLVHTSLNTLREKGFIIQKETINYLCNTCMEFLPKRFRISPNEATSTGKQRITFNKEYEMQCGFCGSKDIIEHKAKHWFLDLNKAVELIRKEVSCQDNRFVRNYLSSVIDEGLMEWDITRENYFGIRIPFAEDNQYVYLWYESLVGYLFLSPFELNEVSFRHFLGKNIVYYHGIIWPVLLKEGFSNTENTDFQISTRGFLNLNESDTNIVDILQAVKQYDPDYIRFYLAYRTPDNMNDFTFTEQEFKRTINSILCRQVGGFLNRCKGILEKSNVDKIPNNGIECEWLHDTTEKIKQSLTRMNINQVLTEVLAYIKRCGNIISTQELYKNPTKEQQELICKMMAGALLFISPFIPNLVQSYNIFENFRLDHLDRMNELGNRKIIYKSSPWRQLDE